MDYLIFKLLGGIFINVVIVLISAINTEPAYDIIIIMVEWEFIWLLQKIKVRRTSGHFEQKKWIRYCIYAFIKYRRKYHVLVDMNAVSLHYSNKSDWLTAIR